ncbi:DUF3459 domain-containing protein [Microcoleus sp. FACHB-1515]|uniref:alpha-amylase family glycosyl hydrolase n=1 Tax=Cyanophyceae TaxID=3028117 RepID=UPI001681D8C8|nr:alpha-amylase family glycosyl hydrolase [Microcoleus sp. FACHB-1515]MBD2090909.1 DUF3459 domain-containing protein [Microcoleus sp. FACHB-1515]
MADGIEFQLFAPRLSEVKLIGSFSNWEEIPMQKGEDGTFRTTIKLEDGVHHYKFRVQSLTEPAGRTVEVNDPYVTAIDRETQNGTVLVKSGKRFSDTYTWQYDDRELAANKDLIIYEMHLADFCGKDLGTHKTRLQHATDRLDYLAELGVNAIELMPVTEYAGDYRWGYLVRDYFALESSYGTPQEFKQFVDECHGRGIRVLMDGIYNHSDENNPLVQIDRDYWFYHEMHYPDDPNNYWGPEFNYDNYDEQLDIKPAWKYVGDVVRFWVSNYHLDGIRFDAVRQLANNNFLKWIAQEATNAAGEKPFYNIAEHIPDSPAITTAQDGPLEACWHESFRIFAIDAISNVVNFDKLKESMNPPQQGYKTAANVINYIASHDREHPLVELSDRQITGKEAFDRAKLGVVLQMTAVGVPMIWMGDEFGQDTRKAENVTNPNPLKWHLLEQELNRDLFEFYKQIIELRKQTPALRTDNIDFFHEDVDNNVLAYRRWDDSGSQVAIVVNFSNQELKRYQCPNFFANTVWKVWRSNHEVKLEGERLTIDLPAFTAAIFVNS